MPKSESVFDVVHSLTRSEKRYFKLFAAKAHPDSDSKLTKLFDAINTQVEYDPDLLSQQFEHVESTKTKLVQVILRAMHSYHSEKDPLVKLKNRMFSAHLLRSRKHYARSMKELVKARKQAQRFEKWESLLEINKMERMIILEQQLKGYHGKILKLRTERAKLIQLMHLEDVFLDRADKLLMLVRERRSFPSKQAVIERLAGVELEHFAENPPLDSFQIRSNLLFANYLLHQLIGEKESAFTYAAELVGWWEKHQLFCGYYSHRYKIVLSNYLNSCHAIESYDDFPATVRKIESIPAQSLDEEAEVFQNVIFVHLLYLLNTHQIKQGLALVSTIAKGMKRYAEKINPSRKIALVHNLVVLHFLAGEDRRGLQWLNELPTDPNVPVGKDVQNFAFLFRVMLTYNARGVIEDDLVRSARRSLMRRKAHGAFESLLLQTFDDIARACNEKEVAMIAVRAWGNIRSEKENHCKIGYRESLYWMELISKRRSPLVLDSE